jgi:hypothetical protein
MKRVQKEFFNQRLDEEEYLDLRRSYEREIALLPPQRLDLVNAARQFESFGELWVAGSEEAKNETCRVVFERVVLDMRTHEIVEVQVAPEFEPLLQLRTLYVTDSRRARG